MNIRRRALGMLSVFLAATAAPALADTYHLADFSGHLNGGNANVKAPFNSVITQGGAVSGHFVYDDQLIPAAGSGFVNVFFSSFPDIGLIPPATAFFLDLGGGIQYPRAGERRAKRRESGERLDQCRKRERDPRCGVRSASNQRHT